MVSLEGGDFIQKYQYMITFMSEKNDVKKNAVVKKVQDTLKPYVVDGTIEATVNAIQVAVVEVSESFPIVSGD